MRGKKTLQGTSKMNMRKFVESLTVSEKEELKSALYDNDVAEDFGMTSEEMKMPRHEAIKAVRNRLGCSLIQARDMVDKFGIKNSNLM